MPGSETLFAAHGQALLQYFYRAAGPEFAAQWFRATVSMKPAEIVDVALPARDEPALANRVFSIRIRARQIR
jgi:hypothetical protein